MAHGDPPIGSWGFTWTCFEVAMFFYGAFSLVEDLFGWTF